MIVLSAVIAGTTISLPLCVALVRVVSSSPSVTGPSPKVMTSVIVPVAAALLTVLNVSSDLTGAEKVYLAIILFLLEYLNVVPRGMSTIRVYI